MSDLKVKGGTTAKLEKVDGDLWVGKKAKIIPESGDKVVVTGGAHFEGPVTLDCDFECQSMRVEGRGWGPGGDILVHGGLTIHGSADIDASVRVDGTVMAQELDIAGHLRSGSVTSKRLRVGGHLTIEGSLKADDVDVGGHMSVTDDIDLSGLRVGGHAKIGGGRISGEVKVRGHLTTTKKLAYGQVQVYGHVRLPAGSSGEKLVALGNLEFEGDAACKVIEVNGRARAKGSCTADSVKVNGKLETGGPLRVADHLEVYGVAETKGEIECGRLSVGGRLVAGSIAAAGRAEITGEVSTDRGLKAQVLRVGAGSRVSGSIVGETVEIGTGVDLGGFWAHATNLRSMGKMTRVDDVWGKEVSVERHSQAKRIYGEVVKMQSGSMAEEVNFTKAADVPKSAHIERGPRKVDRLPEPPL